MKVSPLYQDGKFFGVRMPKMPKYDCKKFTGDARVCAGELDTMCWCQLKKGDYESALAQACNDAKPFEIRVW